LKKLGSLNSPSFCIFPELLPSLLYTCSFKNTTCNKLYKYIKETRKEKNITKIKPNISGGKGWLVGFGQVKNELNRKGVITQPVHIYTGWFVNNSGPTNILKNKFIQKNKSEFKKTYFFTVVY